MGPLCHYAIMKKVAMCAKATNFKIYKGNIFSNIKPDLCKNNAHGNNKTLIDRMVFHKSVLRCNLNPQKQIEYLVHYITDYLSTTQTNTKYHGYIDNKFDLLCDLQIGTKILNPIFRLKINNYNEFILCLNSRKQFIENYFEKEVVNLSLFNKNFFHNIKLYTRMICNSAITVSIALLELIDKEIESDKSKSNL